LGDLLTKAFGEFASKDRSGHFLYFQVLLTILQISALEILSGFPISNESIISTKTKEKLMIKYLKNHLK